ncbi:MAG: hypothetical protein EHM83_01280 [Burkholderiales bacterium]|nr:MAG: hypothetical protein EHM83_01280 [Burkholderiales bacterium]
MSRVELAVDRPALAERGEGLRLAQGAPRLGLRRRVIQALAVGVLALSGGAVLAQPFGAGRMSPDERERLRRELRQQQEQARQGGDPARRGDARAGGRQRMSPQERDQLRRQLRQARPEESRNRGRRRD